MLLCARPGFLLSFYNLDNLYLHAIPQKFSIV